MKDIKENLNRELEGKEAQIRNLKIQNEADKTKFDERLNQIKESVMIITHIYLKVSKRYSIQTFITILFPVFG